jgi:hypothetical protein
MEMVDTIHGPIPRNELSYTDSVVEDEYAVNTARVWTRNGEVVRRDAWVDLKRGVEAAIHKGL